MRSVSTLRRRIIGLGRLSLVVAVAASAAGMFTSTAALASGAESEMASASASAAELLREAREHEAQQDDFVALRRYTDAIALDPTLGDAYLGLGALRLRRGDPREAVRVYDVALSRLPALARALLGRAEANWALGFRPEAEADLESYVRSAEDPSALRELAGWYRQQSQAPAELATWRHIHTLAEGAGDAPLEHEARTMIRALQILVGGADPVSKPAGSDSVRRGIARVAQRGG